MSPIGQTHISESSDNSYSCCKARQKRCYASNKYETEHSHRALLLPLIFILTLL